MISRRTAFRSLIGRCHCSTTKVSRNTSFWRVVTQESRRPCRMLLENIERTSTAVKVRVRGLVHCKTDTAYCSKSLNEKGYHFGQCSANVLCCDPRRATSLWPILIAEEFRHYLGQRGHARQTQAACSGRKISATLHKHDGVFNCALLHALSVHTASKGAL